MSKFKFKITVIGDGFVGKTSLIRKFTQGNFQEDYIQTIGAQFSEYTEDIEGDRCELIFWDIAGQDEFHFLRPAFYRSSLASIIVFSLEMNDFGKESFKHVSDWHKEIKKFCGNIPIILLNSLRRLYQEKSQQNSSIRSYLFGHNINTVQPN